MLTDFVLKGIVMQPTTFCNLNCKYCYLPARDKNLLMLPIVASRVAEGLGAVGNKIEVIWHGGEPLSCGIEHLAELLDPFEDLRHADLLIHAVQTNATLINKRWCEFFKSHSIEVGVSIDGPSHMNGSRTDWGGKETYERTLRGINLLKEAGISFTLICVVTEHSLSKAQELYEFFLHLGCSKVGFNFEEKIGANKVAGCDANELVINFWAELFKAWRANPKVEIRELSRAVFWMQTIEGAERRMSNPILYDIFPSIGYNGDVVLLAPEFLGEKSPKYSDFVVGNVLQRSLSDIIKEGKEVSYVQDFLNGASKCRERCEHFQHCRGGQAGSKFFELGTTDGIETIHCRNSEQRVVEAILSVL